LKSNVIEDILPGDIILVSSPSRQSKLIKKAQKFFVKNFVKNSVNYSHVMMVSKQPQIVIHSVLSGVGSLPLSKILNAESYNSDWRVMRNIKMQDEFIKDGESLWKKVSDISDKFIGEDYNITITHERTESSFCSELIVKIYNELGIIHFNTLPHKTFPAHLQLLLENETEWLDVTHVYGEKIDYIDEDIANIIQQIGPDAGLSSAEIKKFLDNDHMSEPIELVDKINLIKNGRIRKENNKKK